MQILSAYIVRINKSYVSKWKSHKAVRQKTNILKIRRVFMQTNFSLFPKFCSFIFKKVESLPHLIVEVCWIFKIRFQYIKSYSWNCSVEDFSYWMYEFKGFYFRTGLFFIKPILFIMQSKHLTEIYYLLTKFKTRYFYHCHICKRVY